MWCGTGRSLHTYCLFEDILNKGHNICGFDSFKCFSEPSCEDEPKRYGIKKGRCATNKDSVVKHLINKGIRDDFIDSTMNLIKGFFDKR